jgi:hypothetical protein
MDILARIKRCALLGNVRFTYKAEGERILDNLSELEVYESLVNANRIEKRIRSVRRSRRSKADYLYIIKSPTVRGEIVYTKGKIVDDHGVEIYYLLISAKLAE